MAQTLRPPLMLSSSFKAARSSTTWALYDEVIETFVGNADIGWAWRGG